jgi:transposase-like protein
MNHHVHDSLLDTVARLLERHEVFERDRKTTDTRALALLLYHEGLSCRATARLVTELAEYVCPATVSHWQRRATDLFREEPVRYHEELAVDETKIHLHSGDGDLEVRYLWAAVNPATHEVVHVALTQGRSMLEARPFLRATLRRMDGEPRRVHVDGGPWYPAALDQLDLRWDVTSGGPRNQVEAWYAPLKHRLEAFWRHFPATAREEGVDDWLKGYVAMWNRGRAADLPN